MNDETKNDETTPDPVEVKVKVCRAFEAQIRDVSNKGRTVTAVINTNIVDRYRTVIVPGGGDWSNFMKSRSVTWQHGKDPTRGSQPVGCCTSIKYRKSDDDLLGVIKFWNDEFSRNIFDMYEAGVLTSFSIEFVPNSASSSRPTKDELRARPDWKDADTIYRDWEMTGLSSVTYPGNPQAVALAVERGLWVPDEAKVQVTTPVPATNLPDILLDDPESIPDPRREMAKREIRLVVDTCRLAADKRNVLVRSDHHADEDPDTARYMAEALGKLEGKYGAEFFKDDTRRAIRALVDSLKDDDHDEHDDDNDGFKFDPDRPPAGPPPPSPPSITYTRDELDAKIYSDIEERARKDAHDLLCGRV